MKFMKKKSIIYGLIIVIAFTGAFVVLNKKKDKAIPVKTVIVEKGDIKAYLSTTATIKSKSLKDYYGIQAKVNRVNVAVGDRVKKGDALVAYDTGDLVTALKQAEIQYSNAILQRDDLRDQNNSIKEKLSELDKQINELEQSPNISDKAKAESVKQQKSSLMPISEEKLQLSNNSVKLAKLGLDSARQRVRDNKAVIYASTSGVVTSVNVTAGTAGNLMQAAIETQDIDNLKAQVSLGKYDANKIKLGQSVIIKNSNKTYRGRISSINPIATKSMPQGGGDASLAVEIDILDKAPDLKIDFDVDVDILIGQVNNVIKIPAECIKIEKGDRNLAYILEGKMIHEKLVKIGLRSDTDVEVISGLNPGEAVILNPTVTVVEGAKGKVEK